MLWILVKGLDNYAPVSPTQLSRQQASESVLASLMNKPRGPEDPREALAPGQEGGKETVAGMTE